MYMNKISKKFVLFSYKNLLLSFIIAFAFLILSFSLLAHASVTPTLSLTPTGDGDSVQLNITGDPNTSVLLYYFKTGSGQQMPSIGTTNSNGTLTTTISSSNYGIPSSSIVHISSGLNGLQSANVTWPSVSSLTSSSNMLSLSQTGLVLQIGQSSTLTASNLNSSSLYVSSNTNPVIANANISSNQITIYANSYGSTVITFCLVSNSSNCGSVYVTVQNSNAQALTFSQNSISMYSGQTVPIQITGNSGSYLVYNNGSQNNGIVQTSISGSVITLTTNSTTGSSSITVCSTDMTSCGIINVTIGTASNSSAVTFSQSSPTVLVGQSLNISIYGPSNVIFYVSSNSNPNVVQANMSGSTLTLLGIINGTSTISVCASSTNCGSLSVTVNSNSSSGGALLLSQQNVNLSVGQTTTVTISGGMMPYSIASNANNIFQSTLNSNILTLYGVSSGSSLMNVCSYSGNCVTLSVTVGSIATNPIIPIDCTVNTLFSSSTGRPCPYTTINNTTVSPTPISSTPETTTTTPKPKSSVFKFSKPIKLGSIGTEVSELQKKLKTLGYYKGTISGKFDTATEKAVKAFQKAHKLAQLGNVGPSTRALLNK